MEKGLTFCDPSREAVTHTDGVFVQGHEAQLVLDVLDVPEHAPCDREGVEIVRTEDTSTVADRADRKLILIAVTGKPFPEENAALPRRACRRKNLLDYRLFSPLFMAAMLMYRFAFHRSPLQILLPAPSPEGSTRGQLLFFPRIFQ